MHLQLHPYRTTWHITWGAYGGRLHGSVRPTVDREHNTYGTPFLPQDVEREEMASRLMNAPPVLLSHEQRLFIETEIPRICERGGWVYRIGAAQEDHVHVLLDIDSKIHGEKVRRLLKRWLGQKLDERWSTRSAPSWWAEEGSNRAVKDEPYLRNVYEYIRRQRTSE